MTQTLLGGWQLSNISSFQSGLGLTATLSGSAMTNLGGERRMQPNLIGDPVLPQNLRSVKLMKRLTAETRRAQRIVLLFFLCALGVSVMSFAQDSAAAHHERGVAFHLRRSLDDASREYQKALELDPPRQPSEDQRALVRRFAPRLFTTSIEPFALKDCAAILHPTDRLIAYHFFWEDDIDFPEDNDPTDHELIWVRYSADRRDIEGYTTYFHRRELVAPAEALADARAYGGRPRVEVQWGKHGSMPVGWQKLEIIADAGDGENAYYLVGRPITLEAYNRGTFQKLSTEGHRLVNHPLADGWPRRFSGNWEGFSGFPKLVDTLPLLEQKRMVQVSLWNSAVIDQMFLTYNFRPKTEWPGKPDVQHLQARDFQLPAKDVFSKSMPRYPNLWFYVDASLVDGFQNAVRLVTHGLQQSMRLIENYGPFSNPEGCDFEVTLEHLQPWEGDRQLRHAHAFHMRYYYSDLERNALHKVQLDIEGKKRDFYRFAASAHYEVEHANPHHADVESCPLCGRTGAYENLQGNLVELAHDPLGVELVTRGTIRGGVVRFEDVDAREVGSIERMKDRYQVSQYLFSPWNADMNTYRIAIILLTSPQSH